MLTCSRLMILRLYGKKRFMLFVFIFVGIFRNQYLKANLILFRHGLKIK